MSYSVCYSIWSVLLFTHTLYACAHRSIYLYWFMHPISLSLSLSLAAVIIPFIFSIRHSVMRVYTTMLLWKLSILLSLIERRTTLSEQCQHTHHCNFRNSYRSITMEWTMRSLIKTTPPASRTHTHIQSHLLSDTFANVELSILFYTNAARSKSLLGSVNSSHFIHRICWIRCLQSVYFLLLFISFRSYHMCNAVEI